MVTASTATWLASEAEMPASSRARSGGAVSATVPRAEAAARSAARQHATAAAGVAGTGRRTRAGAGRRAGGRDREPAEPGAP